MAINWEKFDTAFTCPVGVDDDLVTFHEKLLAEYRQECSGLDMSTSAVLRVAMLIGMYIKHLNNSRRAYGCPDGYATPAMQKNAEQAWQAAAREHDDYVGALRARTGASGNLVPSDAVTEAVVTALSRVSDVRLRAQIQDQIATEFEKAGI